MSSYEDKIGLFEGPLDLLLFLVQKQELNPKDISISEITDQFLAYLDSMKEANLSVAGDFLFMASRLMSLKTKELLPVNSQEDIELLEFDEEREALIRQMLEYQKFKEVSNEMRFHEELHFGSFSRGRKESPTEKKEEDLGEAGIYELFDAFRKSMKTRFKENIHTIEVDYVTIEDCQQNIENFLAREGRATFEDMVGPGFDLTVASVNFMALLEMVKQDHIVFRQPTAGSVMWLYRKKNNLDYSDEMSRDETDYTADPHFNAGLAQILKERASKPKTEEVGLDVLLKHISDRVKSGEKISDKQLNVLLDPELNINISYLEIGEAWLSWISAQNKSIKSNHRVCQWPSGLQKKLDKDYIPFVKKAAVKKSKNMFFLRKKF